MQHKTVFREQITHIASRLHVENKKIITTNGTFDILHAGHVQFLEDAKALGDVLIVGLNSDASVKQYKGDKRPINGQEDRARVLSALACVDYVVVFDEREPSALLECIKPHIHAKATDYTLDKNNEQLHTKIWEKETVEKHGGTVKLLPLSQGKSTTHIIQRIIELYKDEHAFKECRFSFSSSALPHTKN